MTQDSLKRKHLAAAGAGRGYRYRGELVTHFESGRVWGKPYVHPVGSPDGVRRS